MLEKPMIRTSLLLDRKMMETVILLMGRFSKSEELTEFACLAIGRAARHDKAIKELFVALGAFELASSVITSWFGNVVMILSLWALWYHTLGGLRHLIWDTGRGLELQAAERMGWMMIIGSLVLTALNVFYFLQGG
jgi:succinate dehydrogenase/fumarate reductase cytochrome b subunit